MRRTGTTHGGSGLARGDHACWTYASADRHREVLVEFFSEGIASNDRLVYLAPRGAERRLAGYLADAGVDPERLLGEGRLSVGTAEEGHAPNGPLATDERLAGYERLADEALAAGYDGVRVAAEAGWLLADARARGLVASYELRADLVAARTPFTALCCYDARSCDTSALGPVLAVHPLRVDCDAAGTGGPRFRVHGAEGGGIAVGGELDCFDAGVLRELLESCLDDLGEPAIDVSGLRFVDVAALEAIACAAARLAERRGAAEVVGASRLFRRLWSLLGHDGLTRVEVPSP